MTVDVSHTRLASDHLNFDFLFGNRDSWSLHCHYHLGDAKGVDGKACRWRGGYRLRIARKNDGDACPRREFHSGNLAGHKNFGEGFWIALARLERSCERHLYEQYHLFAVETTGRTLMPLSKLPVFDLSGEARSRHGGGGMLGPQHAAALLCFGARVFVADVVERAPRRRLRILSPRLETTTWWVAIWTSRMRRRSKISALGSAP